MQTLFGGEEIFVKLLSHPYIVIAKVVLVLKQSPMVILKLPLFYVFSTIDAEVRKLDFNC